MKINRLFFCALLAFCLSFDTFASIDQKIENLLRSAYEKGEYSGVVLVAKGDKIIYKGAVGMTNREWKIPNKTDTKFRINSITKQFTTMLIMQLVEEGKVKLDSTISVYLPDFPKQFSEKITIKDLLMSSSGLPDFDVPGFYATQDEKLTKFEYLTENFLKGELQFEPGSKFNYNNGDFLTAGAIIEKVTGKTFELVLQEKILTPLKIKDTGMIENGKIIEGLASGYLYKEGKFYKEPFYSIENYGAAGAMYSTLDDMFLWDKALNENKLLSKENTEIMFTASPKLGFVALGSWVYDIKLAENKSWKLVERQGGIGGFSSLNIISPDEKLSVIFLGNVGTGTLFMTYAKQGLSFEVLKVLAEI
jgi:CubicO group peptidase (beta-lactamase class C family)